MTPPPSISSIPCIKSHFLFIQGGGWLKTPQKYQVTSNNLPPFLALEIFCTHLYDTRTSIDKLWNPNKTLLTIIVRGFKNIQSYFHSAKQPKFCRPSLCCIAKLNFSLFWPPLGSMVLILDGNSAHVAHIWSKVGLFWRKKIGFDESFDVTKCLQQIEIPDLPSNKRTMVDTTEVRFHSKYDT